jgi:hypothetical protein
VYERGTHRGGVERERKKYIVRERERARGESWGEKGRAI